jgi:hypothetical protein
MLEGGGDAWLGGNGTDGDLMSFTNGGKNGALAQSTVHLEGSSATARVGGNRHDSDLGFTPMTNLE